MRRLASWLGSGRAAIVLSVLVIAGSLLFALVDLYPYADNVDETRSVDDWEGYKRNALSILDGGLHIPVVRGPYWIPGGFLYNYFVAAVFAIAGRSSGYVYVVHFGCVALGAVLMFLLARRWLPGPLAAVYLAVTTPFLFSAYRYWMRMLLSENLLIVLYPLALLLFFSAIEWRSPGRLAVAGLMAGLVILTRPNLVVWPFLLASLILWSGGGLRRRVADMGVFGIAALAGALILPLRNLYVTGQWMASARYGNLIPSDLGASDVAVMFGKRLLFCAGFVFGNWDFEGGAIWIYKRWLLITVAAVLAVVYLAVTRRLRLIDAACILTLAAAYGPFIVLPPLGGYGFRFQAPYGPLLLLLVFRALHEWWHRPGAPASSPAGPAA